MTSWRRFGLPGGRALTPRQLVDAPESQLQRFLVDLGDALVSAGIGVSEAANTLRQAAVAMGAPDAQLIVFPTALMVSIRVGEVADEEHIAARSTAVTTLRFDQLTKLYDLTERAKRAAVTPTEGLRELDEIQRLPPRFPAYLRILGNGIAAAGVCLLLAPGWIDLAIAFALGLLVGGWVLVTPALTTTRILAPVLAAFGVGLIVFVLAEHGIAKAPLTELVPPLITYIPGSVLTVAVGELAAGDIVAGASRLVYGCLLFAELALGILAADAVIGLPASEALRSHSNDVVGQSTPWLGVLVLGVGFFLLYCGPRLALPWLLLVLVVAYCGQVIGGALVGGLLSGVVGAVLMTPTAYVVQVLPHAPPAVVMFLPGFWLLIPGAVGLIGLTQVVGSHSPSGASFLSFAATIFAVSAGVLIGTGIYRMMFRYAPVSWGLRRA
jgi:uncharacterized membrane protein YjjP (DUF1212 family)